MIPGSRQTQRVVHEPLRPPRNVSQPSNSPAGSAVKARTPCCHSGRHGEVTSLRARPEPEGSGIALWMVDEYGTEITLPAPHVPLPLTPEEIVSLFQAADPSPTETSCEVRFHSWFYPNLNEVAGAANML
jgi:hypothetical protein